MNKRRLAAVLLCLGLCAAEAHAFIKAPSFVDWFVRNFRRILSELRLDGAQRAALEQAKRPLADAIEATVKHDRHRVSRLRELFGGAALTLDEFRAHSARRRQRSAALEASVRAEAQKLLVAMHGLLRPKQRQRLIDYWARGVERRNFRYERPLQ